MNGPKCNAASCGDLPDEVKVVAQYLAPVPDSTSWKYIPICFFHKQQWWRRTEHPPELRPPIFLIVAIARDE